MKPLKIIVCSALAFGLTGMSQVALAEMRDLTKNEITETFSGKTVWSNHANKNRSSKTYYAPDGTLKNKRSKDIGTREGKWYVDDKNLLCKEYDGDTKCRRVVDKSGKLKMYKGKKHVGNYKKFKDGNCLEKC